ncbi:MAG: hypothetical protein N3H31_00575 [Candidatus Nezhaarchaeota archaeon]|nr:hypothetical protein [Candidatus Nezhaarchaeota archaeon]
MGTLALGFSSQGVLDTIRTLIDEVLSVLQGSLTYFLSKLLSLVITIARASYIAIGLIGLFLWLSHISPYRGREMVIGSILIAIASEVAARILPIS